MQGVLYTYITSILTVGVCAFICETVSGIGGSSKLSDAMKFTSSLCVFIAVLLPFGISLKGIDTKAIKNLFDENSTQLNNSQSFEALLDSEIKSRIEDEIVLSTEKKPMEISVSYNKDNTAINSITVKHNISDTGFIEKAGDAIMKLCNIKAEFVFVDSKEVN